MKNLIDHRVERFTRIGDDRVFRFFERRELAFKLFLSFGERIDSQLVSRYFIAQYVTIGLLEGRTRQNHGVAIGDLMLQFVV